MNRNYVGVIACEGLPFTKAAVASILASDIPCEILLIDNASRDDTRSHFVENPDPRIHLLGLPQRESVAHCWNMLCRIAFNDGCEHLLIIGNDVILPPHFYRLLIADGGQLVTGVGDGSMECLKAEPRPFDRRPFPDYSAFLIRREAWEKVPFDEEYAGAYGEDCQSDLDLAKAGIDAYSLGVAHYHAMNGVLKNSTPEEAAAIHAQASANRGLFAAKNGFEIASPEYYATIAKLRASFTVASIGEQES